MWFPPSRGYVCTTEELHLLDSYKTIERKANWEIHKNGMCCFEQILGAVHTKQQLYSHLLLISQTIQIRWTRHDGHCWRSMHKLISDTLLSTPTHEHNCAGRRAKTYIVLWGHQIQSTGLVRSGRWYGWMDRESRDDILSAWFDDNGDLLL